MHKYIFAIVIAAAVLSTSARADSSLLGVRPDQAGADGALPNSARMNTKDAVGFHLEVRSRKDSRRVDMEVVIPAQRAQDVIGVRYVLG